MSFYKTLFMQQAITVLYFEIIGNLLNLVIIDGNIFGAFFK